MVLSGAAIGADGTPLLTDAGTLDATATGTVGGIYIEELNTINLNNLLTTDGEIVVDAGTGIIATSVVTGTDNDITLNTAAGDITIDIDAGVGTATITADGNIGDAGGMVTAGDAVLTAGGNIIVDTTVGSLQADSNGLIIINETDGLELADINTLDGDVVINAGGTITATDVQAGGSEYLPHRQVEPTI